MAGAASLFQPRPRQWGLRGDPYLWEEMERHFSGRPLPPSETAFRRELEDFFAACTASVLGSREMIFVERFAHGGMSGGQVSHKFWEETGIPLLLSRLRSQRLNQVE